MRKKPSSRDIEYCLFCPNLCLSRCPVSLASGNLNWSPWGKQSSAWRLSSKLVEPAPETTVPLYLCLDCLGCREACEHGIDVPSNLAAARRDLPSAMRPYGIREGEAEAPEQQWAALQAAAPRWRVTDECRALLVPGPELLTEGSAPVLQALFRALDALGDIVVGVNQDSLLECGHELHAAGSGDAAERQAGAARKRWGRYSRVIFASPHCASFIRLQWPEVGLAAPRTWVTLVEFVGSQMNPTRGGFFPHRLVWHDPCHLARHLGLDKLPRDVLAWAANAQPLEPAHTRSKALCCGGGPPLPAVAAELAGRIAARRAEELARTGAEAVVTGCALCRQQLTAAMPATRVMHLAELIAELVP